LRNTVKNRLERKGRNTCNGGPVGEDGSGGVEPGVLGPLYFGHNSSVGVEMPRRRAGHSGQAEQAAA